MILRWRIHRRVNFEFEYLGTYLSDKFNKIGEDSPGVVPKPRANIDEGEGDEEQSDHGEPERSLPAHSLNTSNMSGPDSDINSSSRAWILIQIFDLGFKACKKIRKETYLDK